MNSLTEDQKKMIVLEYGATKIFAEVKKAFAKQYYPKHPRKVPHWWHSKGWSIGSAKLHPARSNNGLGDQRWMKRLQQQSRLFSKKRKSIREASKELGLSTGTVWRVLKTKLKWKAYRLRRSQCLTAAHSSSWPSLASEFSRSFTNGLFFLESGIKSFEESKACNTGRNEAGSWRICSQSGWECGSQDVTAHQKAGFSLYRGWRPPICTSNGKLLRQISAFKLTLVLYFSLCITRFIISRTDNTISGTHSLFIYL